MYKRFTLIIIAIVIAWCGILVWNSYSPSVEAFSKATIRYGAKGADVYELQGRLQFVGFYKGKIDGQFGYMTLTALKTFQRRFGLPTDGIAGPKTKVKLWEATKIWSQDRTPIAGSTQQQRTPAAATKSNHLGLSSNDMKLMANAVYGEARGEPYIGQVAVAAVILNRLKSSTFPNTISGVIFEPRAFTAVADGQIWMSPNEKAHKAVQEAINGHDPTGNCLYYFNPNTATSAWIWTRPQVKKIGKHIFCL